MSVRTTGLGLLAISLATFLYYTVWVIILPFVDEEQVYIHGWFPDRQYAIALPLLAGVIGLVCIGTFVAAVMWNGARKQKSS